MVGTITGIDSVGDEEDLFRRIFPLLDKRLQLGGDDLQGVGTTDTKVIEPEGGFSPQGVVVIGGADIGQANDPGKTEPGLSNGHEGVGAQAEGVDESGFLTAGDLSQTGGGGKQG